MDENNMKGLPADTAAREETEDNSYQNMKFTLGFGYARGSSLTFPPSAAYSNSRERAVPRLA